SGRSHAHTRGAPRQASIRMRYVASTSAPEPSTRNQSSLSSSSAGATSPHCFATSRTAKPMTTAATTHCATSVSLLLGRANDGAIDTSVAARGRFRRKASECDHSPGPPELGAALGVIEQPIERCCQGVNIARRNEEAGAVVLHGVGETAGLVRNYRCLAELSLDRDQAQPFVSGRNDQRRGAPVQVDQLRLGE